MKTKEKIRAIRKYSWYLFKHRTFVTLECFREGLIWRGLKHDLSKFRPDEFFAYAFHFYSDNKPKRDNTGYYKPYGINSKFDIAWLKHTRRNDHHWQWAALCKDTYNENVFFEMPEAAWKEMICDWFSASRAQKNTCTVFEWYEVNRCKIQLHPETRKNGEKEHERRKR